jgi:hypothetical protein
MTADALAEVLAKALNRLRLPIAEAIARAGIRSS